MKELFPDWRAQGVTVCLHEHQGGFAFNVESVIGLRDKCLAEGVQIHSYTEVTGFELGDDDAVTAVETSKGRVEVGEQVVIAPGPWAKRFWAHARAARRRSTSTRPRATSPATSRCGRTGTCRRARSPSIRSCSRPPTAARRP